jgi:rhodanese-related sulfurtransferase
MQKILCFISFFLIAILSQQVHAIDNKEKGQKLFAKHGCTNCHGKNGVHPTSKYAPVLKGKQADYIIKKTTAIFNGEKLSNRTSFMHEQFCIGENKEDDGCYPIPSAKEIEHIAKWLSPNLSKKKTTPQALYVSSQQAYEKLKELGNKALFIDTRTRAEVAFLGMPNGVDANIPYMMIDDFSEWNDKKKNFMMRPNSAFSLQMDNLLKKRSFSKESPIFLICRSGSRSAKAAKLLFATGYSKIYSVVDGFEGDKAKEGSRKGQRVVNGWKNSGLPWSYKLNKRAMFFEL